MELLEVEVEEVRLQLGAGSRGLTYFRASSSHSHSPVRSPGMMTINF